mmetsp:Transcript_10217/g.22666  ORF Transcript_10217/g.22666 Transcript_10217/m.22666 type:complete len:233 (+) Transcript_10217:778-1476(+)
MKTQIGPIHKCIVDTPCQISRRNNDNVCIYPQPIQGSQCRIHCPHCICRIVSPTPLPRPHNTLYLIHQHEQKQRRLCRSTLRDRVKQGRNETAAFSEPPTEEGVGVYFQKRSVFIRMGEAGSTLLRQGTGKGRLARPGRSVEQDQTGAVHRLRSHRTRGKEKRRGYIGEESSFCDGRKVEGRPKVAEVGVGKPLGSHDRRGGRGVASTVCVSTDIKGGSRWRNLLFLGCFGT